MARATRSAQKKSSPALEEAVPMAPLPTKSKAELRRQSISRAKEWATDRKKKKVIDLVDDDDDVEKTEPVESDIEEGEAKDKVDEKLPSITTRRSARSRGGTTKAVVDNEDQENVVNNATPDAGVSSRARRSSRRRTMNVSSTPTTADSAKAAKPPTRRSRRMTTSPAKTKTRKPESKTGDLENNQDALVTVTTRGTRRKAVLATEETPEIKVETNTVKVEVKEEEEEETPEEEEAVVESQEAEEEVEDKEEPQVKLTRRSRRKIKSPAKATSPEPESKIEELDDKQKALNTVTTKKGRRKTVGTAVETPAINVDKVEVKEEKEAEEEVEDKETEVKTPRRSRRKTKSPAKATAPEPESNAEEADTKQEAPGTVAARRSQRKSISTAIKTPEIKVETSVSVEVVKEEETADDEEAQEEVKDKETGVKLEMMEKEMEVKLEEEEEPAVQEEIAECILEEVKEDEPKTDVNQVVKEQLEPKVKQVAHDVAKELPTEQTESLIESPIHLAPVFFHFLVSLWTLTFAIMITFGFDWFVNELSPADDVQEMSSQRAPCTIIGLWLVTIVGYSLTFGPQSRVGWILTGSALAMVSASTKLIAGNGITSVPSLPIYSRSDFDVNVPDLLVVLCLVGTLAALKQPITMQERSHVVANAVPSQADSPDETQAEIFKEREDNVPEATDPRSIVGHRVAARKEAGTIFGVVKDYDCETREWLVRYGDKSEQEERLSCAQLESAFKLYSNHLSDSLKAM